MTKKVPIAHQKVHELYLRLLSEAKIDDKKSIIRKIIEQIVNYLLLKYLRIDVDDNQISEIESPSFLSRIKLLVKDKRILKIHEPSFYFLYKEGNMGSHSSSNTRSAGEESNINGLIICIIPLIKMFFNDEDLNSDFLDEYNQKNNDTSQGIVINSHLESANSEIQRHKIEKEKKLLIYVFASVLLLLVTISTFFIKSLYSDLDSSQEKINEYLKINSSQNELIKSKQAKIDSLNLIINTSQQKSNINNGIQNDFKGKVDNVTNVGKVDKLEL